MNYETMLNTELQHEIEWVKYNSAEDGEKTALECRTNKEH